MVQPSSTVVVPAPRPFVPFRCRAWIAAAAAPLPSDEAIAEVYRRCSFVRASCTDGIWTATIDERALAAAMSRATLRFAPFPLAGANTLMRERVRVDPLHEPRVICGNNIAAIAVYTPPLWLLLRAAVGANEQYDVVVPAHYLFFMYHSMFLTLAGAELDPPLGDAPDVPAWAEGDATDAAFELFVAAADRDTIDTHVQTFLVGVHRMPTPADTDPTEPLADDVVRANVDRIVGYASDVAPLADLCEKFPVLRHWTPSDADVAAAREYERMHRRFVHWSQLHPAEDDVPALEPAVVAERLRAIADAPLTANDAETLYRHYAGCVVAAPTAAELLELAETLPPRRGPMTDAVRAIAREQFVARRTEIRAQIKRTSEAIERTRRRNARQQQAWTAQINRLLREMDSLAVAQLEQARVRWRTDDAQLSDLAFLTVQAINNVEMALMCLVNVPVELRQTMQTLPAMPRAEHVPADVAACCEEFATKLLAAAAAQPADAPDPLFPRAFPRELLTATGAAGFNAALMHRLRNWDSFTARPENT